MPSSSYYEQVLLDYNGMSLWLWFECCVAMAGVTAIVTVFYAVTSNPVSLWSLSVSIVAMACATLAHYLRSKNGWVEVLDDGFQAFAEDKENLSVEEVSPDFLERERKKNFEKFSSQTAALAIASFFVVLGSLGAVVYYIIEANAPACVAYFLLALSASTLPLFAHAKQSIELSDDENLAKRILTPLLAAISILWPVCAAVALVFSFFAQLVLDVADWLRRTRVCCPPSGLGGAAEGPREKGTLVDDLSSVELEGEVFDNLEYELTGDEGLDDDEESATPASRASRLPSL